mgnify:CR=1 FL=1
MVKKKLTKAQVKRKFKQIINASYTLFLDKLGHRNESLVPMSLNKLLEFNRTVDQAFNRIN